MQLMLAVATPHGRAFRKGLEELGMASSERCNRKGLAEGSLLQALGNLQGKRLPVR